MWWDINVIEYKIVKIDLAEQQSHEELLVRSPRVFSLLKTEKFYL